MIKFTYDEVAKMAYVKLNDEKVVRTETLEEPINIDYDGDGNVVGIEIFV